MKEIINKVFNEDCLETMKRMPDKSIDLVLTIDNGCKNRYN